MSNKKTAILIGVAISIAILGGAGFYFRNEVKDLLSFGQSGRSEDKVYVEKLSKVMNQYSGMSSRYNGVVETQDTYEVSVDNSRTIAEIKVEVGDQVEEGQTLAIYDTSDIDLQIRQANLQIESINNDIEGTNKQIEMLALQRDQQKTDADKFTYTAQIQNLENSIEQKKFDLRSKQLEIDKYKDQLKNADVVSKAAGIVKEINPKGMDANGNSAPFMRILQAGDYRVKGSIDEQNVWMLSEGQAVIIRSRVDAAKTWTGTIAKIDTENPASGSGNSYSYGGMYDGNSERASKYPFYIELASREDLILGQHVYIEMDEGQEQKKDGLWLYASYIVQDDGKPYVWAANQRERLEKRYVELGAYDENMDQYEIRSGLTGEDFVAWPMLGLYEGVKTVTNAEEVDYSAPLYNQESTEYMDDGVMPMEDMEGVFGTEAEYDIEMMQRSDMEEAQSVEGEDMESEVGE
ncbi:MAG: efflux RND transporter periplasmic adaptor subunit [Roseburia sp.]